MKRGLRREIILHFTIAEGLKADTIIGSRGPQTIKVILDLKGSIY